ncbi:MAG TPA: hypothetical protein DHW82_00135 [Spirochaetia bacterium]|nr:MAG: hypothetical protein A2Y41_04465 [Spirochaetes bacterium GWB1_36_13]HCL55409.1 hypothetical protein [Spirochaetia bacterium]
MAKQAEIDYIKNIGGESVYEAHIEKPFPFDECGSLLSEIGAVISLLPPPPARLLDLGCGSGWTSVFFAKRGYEVMGVDIAPDMIQLAEQNKERNRLENLSFIISDYESLNFDNEFDVVVFFDSLHHAEDETLALEKAFKSLKKGGFCIAAEPGRGHEKKSTVVDVVNKYGVTEKSMPPKKIIKIGKKIGFTRFKKYPHFNSLNKLIYGKHVYEKKWLNKIRKCEFLNALASFFLIYFYKRYSGITVMKK